MGENMIQVDELTQTYIEAIERKADDIARLQAVTDGMLQDINEHLRNLKEHCGLTPQQQLLINAEG